MQHVAATLSDKKIKTKIDKNHSCRTKYLDEKRQPIRQPLPSDEIVTLFIVALSQMAV